MLLDIFNNEKISVENGWYIFNPNYLKADYTGKLLTTLLSQLDWQTGEIKLFGKTHPIPRKEVYFSDNKKAYGYSGKQLKIEEWHPEVLKIREQLNQLLNTNFNACLLNLYENGKHSNGWHADNEKEMGTNPTIASLSIGVTRKFDLKHTKSKKKYRFPLSDGSLFVMGGEMQHYYKHTIPRELKITAPRINLTFREIK